MSHVHFESRVQCRVPEPIQRLDFAQRLRVWYHLASWVGHLELLKHQQGVSPWCDLPVAQRVAHQFAKRFGHRAMATLDLLESDPSRVGHYKESGGWAKGIPKGWPTFSEREWPTLIPNGWLGQTPGIGNIGAPAGIIRGGARTGAWAVPKGWPTFAERWSGTFTIWPKGTPGAIERTPGRTPGIWCRVLRRTCTSPQPVNREF